MSDQNTQVFDVYLLDMYFGECGWEENNRHLLGKLEVNPAIGTEIDDVDVLNAMKRFTYTDVLGREIKAITSTDRRRVYAEDYYGSGEWWEVGTVKGHVPVYGLMLRDEAA